MKARKASRFREFLDYALADGADVVYGRSMDDIELTPSPKAMGDLPTRSGLAAETIEAGQYVYELDDGRYTPVTDFKAVCRRTFREHHLALAGIAVHDAAKGEPVKILVSDEVSGISVHANEQAQRDKT